MNDWLCGPGAYSRLGQIHRRTLVAARSLDTVVPAGNARILSKRTPGGRLVIYRGAGHAFLFQDSVAFRDEVLRFLR